MIFVSVGTLNRPFNRLVKGVDSIAVQLGEEVMIQTGYSTYVPEKCSHFKFCNHDEMLSYVKDATIVIAHSGFGIIGNSIKLQRPMILVPREIKFGEAIDKQYELAEHIAAENESVICLTDVTQLLRAVQEIRGKEVKYSYKNRVPELINEFIAGKYG